MSLSAFISPPPTMGSTPGHWRTLRHQICIFKTEIREDMGHMSVLNISQVGGGADLASKAQILAYYELVLDDLKVSLINFNIIITSRSL